MLNRIVLSFVAVTCLASMAQASDGREAAVEVCKSLYYQDDKDKCLKIVEGADYFDKRATKICNSLYDADDKIKCIKVAQNKKYLSATIDICEGKYYADDKISCLGDNGRAKEKENETSVRLSRLERAAVIAGIERAIREIKAGDDDEAIERLRALVSELE